MRRFWVPILLCLWCTLAGCVRLGFEPPAGDLGRADAPGTPRDHGYTDAPNDAAPNDAAPNDAGISDVAVADAGPQDLVVGDLGPVTGSWVAGSATAGPVGSYGIKGTPAAANVPGGRYGSAMGSDSKGQVWAFGGNRSAASAAALSNDLWRFDGTYWTWIAGASTTMQAGVYGQQGVAAAGNAPGSRQYPTMWVDSKDTIWIFGGWGRDVVGAKTGWLNDLWRFDGTAWTWITGSQTCNQTATYGTQGVSAPSNSPGGRDGGATSRDSKDQLWVFGGKGHASETSYGYLNDLWRFDGKAWTWIAGSVKRNPAPVHGTRGVASASNHPGGRAWACAWHDAADNLWIFGGVGLDAQSASTSKLYLLNDLWRFDGKAWTWVAGSKIGDQVGAYGTKGVGGLQNTPGARYKMGCWHDAKGLWLFGGLGYGSGTSADGLNDVWRFDGAFWTWIAGSDKINVAGVYGKQGVPTAANHPGARGSLAGCKGAGGAWIFSGFGIDASNKAGLLNDLWRLRYQ